MRVVVIFAALSSLLVCRASSSCAAVIPVDLSSPGDELLTRDLDNGLDWLDLTVTLNSDSPPLNRTFNDISSQLGPGGEFEGFRHATAAELVAMLTSAGVPDIDAGGTAANYAPISQLLSLLGVTHPTGSFSQGLLADSNEPGTHQYALLEVFPEIARARTNSGDILDDQSDLSGGHFLVRQAPEPATFVLAAVGLVALAAYGCRRHAPATLNSDYPQLAWPT